MAVFDSCGRIFIGLDDVITRKPAFPALNRGSFCCIWASVIIDDEMTFDHEQSKGLSTLTELTKLIEGPPDVRTAVKPLRMRCLHR